MKKWLSIIIIFTILINALFPNYILAEKNRDSFGDIVGSKDEVSGLEMINKLINEGTVSIPGENKTSEDKKIGEQPNFGGWVAGSLVIIFFPIVYVVRLLETLVAPSTDIVEGYHIGWFTIQGLLTNKIELVNADTFNTKTGNDTNNEIKELVKKWYYAIWILATIISLLMLVYIGIRMAMSTVAGDKATYKMKLIAWFESIILLFVMHFIIRAIFWASDILVQMLTQVLEGILSQTATKNIDLAIFDALGTTLSRPRGWKPVEHFICYILLTYYEVKFLLIYVKRFITINFLVVVSPLVTVTYSMDKAGDGEPQAFKILLKELIINILLQPMHLFLYAVLLGFATNIILEFPLFTILLIIGVASGEKIIKQVFKMAESATVEEIKKEK